MDKGLTEILTNLIIIGIPECAALTMLMLAFLQLPVIGKKILIVAMIQAITVILFRMLSNSLEQPGLHTAAAVITLGILISLFWKAPKVKTLTCSIVALSILMVIEILYYKLFQILFSETIEQIVQSNLYWYLGAWLHILTLTVIALIIMRSQWYRRALISTRL